MTETLTALRESLAGDLLIPSDGEYERARLCFNLLIDRRPAAIARCLGPDDVRAALAYAREHDLELAVRGGVGVNGGAGGHPCPARERRHRASAVDGPTNATRPAAVAFVTTEHYTLQSARASTIAESNGRATMIFGSLPIGVGTTA